MVETARRLSQEPHTYWTGLKDTKDSKDYKDIRDDNCLAWNLRGAIFGENLRGDGENG
jgi:hypothetical protein